MSVERLRNLSPFYQPRCRGDGVTQDTMSASLTLPLHHSPTIPVSPFSPSPIPLPQRIAVGWKIVESGFEYPGGCLLPLAGR